MIIVILKILGILALPVIVFMVFGAAMVWITGHREPIDKLRAEGIQPLNMRYFGYGQSAFREFYDKLGDNGRKIERFFLEVDLIFPLFYGGALAISLLLVWGMLGRPFNPAWVFLPVVAAMAADWAENLIHLAQLGKFIDKGIIEPSASWVAVACTATVLKIWLIVGSYLMLTWLCVKLIVSSARSG